MLKNLLLSMLVCVLLTAVDETFKEKTDYRTMRRNRIFKFTLYQDLLVALRILKMMVIEGCTVGGVMQRFRASGLVNHLYMATSVMLHGTLLFDENTNHQVRLNPAPYLPPTVDECVSPPWPPYVVRRDTLHNSQLLVHAPY